jgi:TonB family protein
MKSRVIFFIIIYANSFNLLAQSDSTSIPDVYPCFQGCSMYKDGSNEKTECSNNKVLAYIKAHLIYPEKDIEAENEGTVYVKFTVNEDGGVIDIKVLNKIGIDLEKEAIAVIKSMPNWLPATRNRTPISNSLTIPIQFKLSHSNQGYIMAWNNIKGKVLEKNDLKNYCKESPIVINKDGEKQEITELTIERYRNEKVNAKEQSKGYLNDRQIRIIKKSKPGDELVITVTIPSKGQFIYLDKTFKIIK